MGRLFERAEERLRQMLDHPIDKRVRAFFVDDFPGRSFAVTDVHGCFHTFLRLVDKLELTSSDRLFILGDMVNRGPYSYYVLEAVAGMIAKGYNVFPLRGNHEQMLLDLNGGRLRKLSEYSRKRNSGHLLNRHGKLDPEVARFLDRLPHYYETRNEFLVHAGFNTELRKPLADWKDMLNVRSFKYDEAKLKGKRVIHGHVPVELSHIRKKLAKGSRKIDLDNGCVNVDEKGQGNLVCMELNSMQLIVQKNADVVPA